MNTKEIVSKLLEQQRRSSSESAWLYPASVSRKTTKKVIVLKDDPPNPHKEDEEICDSSDNGACQVCKANTARYTCPRCEVCYCSARCYRTHGANNLCSEAFYKERVCNMLKIEQKSDTGEAMFHILQRQRQDQRPFLEEEENENDEKEEDDWLAIAEHVYDYDCTNGSIKMKKDIDEEALHEVLERSPCLKARFEAEIFGGKLVTPWHPWWLPFQEHALINKENERTLDDRMLSIPHFSSFRRSTNVTPAILQFNALELLCAYTRVVRLYNGDALEPEAAHTFCHFSSVLRLDSRYQSIISVLVDQPETACDVAHLVGNVRFVCRALFDIQDILSSGIANKTKSKKRTELKGFLKKIEFYTSWSRTYWVALKCHITMKEEINDWISHYELNGPMSQR